MAKSNIKYRVTLTGEEREALQKLVKKGNTTGCRIRHAQILPALDEIPVNGHRVGTVIGGAYGSRRQAYCGNALLRKAFKQQRDVKRGKHRQK